MTSSSYRKLHNNQELFHINMINVPFFYSDKPTNSLILKGIPQIFLKPIQSQLMQKLFYKNNRPVLTTIASFQTIEQAEEFKKKIKQKLEGKNKYFCEFCKDISQFVGILFQAGKVYVLQPETKEIKEIIDTISQMILMNGAQIQEKLKQSNEPTLSFLNERILSLENTYYRWRVYSYLQGDGDKKYRQQEFQIIRNGPVWYPPQNPSSISYPNVLNLKQSKYFTQCLLKMQRRKFAIEQLMAFSIQYVSFAIHITSIIIIQLYENMKQDFMGIFYLISDILFNSTSHTYRNIFQYFLPHVVYRYVLLKQNDQNKEMNEKYYIQLKKLFNLWERKYIFDDHFIKGLIFLLELGDTQKLYSLRNYPEHEKIRQILGSEDYLYEIEKNCIQNGLPFFQNKQQQAKLFLNALIWSNQQISDVDPDFGKFDGQVISQKQLLKIQSKGLKVVSCQNLPISMLFDKNWKQRTSQTSLSQDGA